jgi:D-alanyl-D-alanine carboxypeptidase
MKRNILIILALTLFWGTSYSQNLNFAKLDSLFKSIEASNKFMGSIAISENGKILYTKSIGYSDVETSQKSNKQTKYRIGSITKIFTAVLILKAVEEKKLKLDETIEKYFPKIKNANKISVRHLLTHRSGIHNFTKDKDYLTYNIKGKSKIEMIDIISNFESDFEPNSKANYSNSNFVLLSYILEDIYSQSFAEILKNKIVKPLKLYNTYFGNEINTSKNEANSYDLDTTWKKQPETNMSILTGAGAIVSTPNDVLRFVQAVFKNKIISMASLKAMEEVRDDYGMGIGEFPFEEKMSYGHTGHLDGFSSLFGYFPKENISFVITSNGSSVNNNDIALGLLNIIFNLPYQIPTKF